MMLVAANKARLCGETLCQTAFVSVLAGRAFHHCNIYFADRPTSWAPPPCGMLRRRFMQNVCADRVPSLTVCWSHLHRHSSSPLIQRLCFSSHLSLSLWNNFPSVIVSLLSLLGAPTLGSYDSPANVHYYVLSFLLLSCSLVFFASDSFPPSPLLCLSPPGAALQCVRPERHLHHCVRSRHRHVLYADGLHWSAADGEFNGRAAQHLSTSFISIIIFILFLWSPGNENTTFCFSRERLQFYK